MNPININTKEPGVKINRRNSLLLGASGLAACSSISLPNVLATNPGVSNNDTTDVTKESERSVKKAQEWLLKTINQDGGCGVDVSQPSDIGCSCMVGLAFMSQGNTAVEGERQGDLRRMRKFMLQQVANMPSDDITSAQGTQLQNKIGRHAHSFFAALFLSQLFGEGTNPDPVKDALKRVIAAIVKAQTADGDWGNRSWAPTLGTVMGWVSLRAADFAGVSVGGAPEKTAEHLIRKMQQNLNNKRGWMHQLYKNASGIRVLYAMKMENEPVAKKAFAEALRLVSNDNTPFTQAGGEEFLAFHLITETMLQKGGEDWDRWFPTVRDKLIKVQNSDGSWTGHHCITSRTFCTAAAILVLTSPYRYLPISQG